MNVIAANDNAAHDAACADPTVVGLCTFNPVDP
jgi:hypothetical protein